MQTDSETKPTSEHWLAQLILPAIISAVVSVVASVVTYDTTIAKARDDYDENFARIINDSMPNLTGPHGGVSLAALMALARTDGERVVLMTVAQESGSDSAKHALALFTTGDPDVHRVWLNNQDAFSQLALADANADAQKSANTAAAKAAARPGAGSDAATQHATTAAAVAGAVPDPGKVELLTTLVKPQLGWIYYGRLGTAGFGECVDPNSPVPKPGQKITLCGDRYIRSSPPATGALANVIGALKAGTVVTINDAPKSYDLSAKAHAIWISVTVPTPVAGSVARS